MAIVETQDFASLPIPPPHSFLSFPICVHILLVETHGRASLPIPPTQCYCFFALCSHIHFVETQYLAYLPIQPPHSFLSSLILRSHTSCRDARPCVSTNTARPTLLFFCALLSQTFCRDVACYVSTNTTNRPSFLF